MRIRVRALVDAGTRQLFRRKTAAPSHVEAVELSMNSSFDTSQGSSIFSAAFM